MISVLSTVPEHTGPHHGLELDHPLPGDSSHRCPLPYPAAAGAELLRPGASVKVSCKTSGYNFTGYYMSWETVRPRQGLQWIGAIDPEDSESIYTQKGKATLTAEKSSSTSYMELKSLTSEDSAVYYCARKNCCNHILSVSVTLEEQEYVLALR
ncbi:Ig heavy chain V region 102 [Cricetulus griseus]|nr:Ig heavy chain V region 102 [Cricetulus griseus]